MIKLFTFPRLAVSTAMAVAAIGAADAQTDKSEMPIRCVIDVQENGRMTQIQSIVESEVATTGTYAVSLRSNGANINQGGPFEVAAGEQIVLAETNMSGSPEDFDISLEIEWDGDNYTCLRSDEL